MTCDSSERFPVSFTLLRDHSYGTQDQATSGNPEETRGQPSVFKAPYHETHEEHEEHEE